MAGFFSLGGGSNRGNNSNQEEEHRRSTTEIPHPDSISWYRNEDVPSNNRGFGLWQQQQQQQLQLLLQQRQFLHQQDLFSSAAALGVGPSGSSINVSVSDDHSSSRSAFVMIGSSSATGRSGGAISCQDCGNQAKKNCVHMRCRTCCKSRGFDCPTHVRSTWVPIAKRRERQQQLAALQQQQEQPQQQLQLRGENYKRERDNISNNNPNPSSLACTRLPSISSGLELGNFPAQLNSSAVFRCVRVSSIDEADDQYAYQTAVNIGGHLFKGVLYDQGPESNYMAPGESSSGGGGAQPLNLIASAADPASTSTLGTTASGDGGGAVTASSAGVLVNPSMYPSALDSFMAGTQFFPHPRS